MEFRYRAIDKNGRASHGVIDATDRDAVAAELHQRGLIPIAATPARRWSFDGISQRFRNDVARQLGSKQITQLTRQLATMLRTGITLTDGIAILQSENQDPAIGQLLESLQDSIASGQPFSAALEQMPTLFDRFFVSIARAGELSGDLGHAMLRLANHRENAARVRAEVVAAVTYPVVLAIVSATSLFIIAVFVMPKFSDMLDGSAAALPLSTAAVLAVCNFLAAHWWLMALIVIAISIWIRSLMLQPTFVLKASAALLQAPPIARWLSATEFAKFSRSMANLIESGIPMGTAMELACGAINNPLLRQLATNAADLVRSGHTVSDALGTIPHLPAFAIPVIAAGEASGAMSEVLNTLADAIEEDAQVSLNRIVAIAEPVLIVGIGMIIALIITSVLSAVMSLNEIGI